MLKLLKFNNLSYYYHYHVKLFFNLQLPTSVRPLEHSLPEARALPLELPLQSEYPQKVGFFWRSKLPAFATLVTSPYAYRAIKALYFKNCTRFFLCNHLLEREAQLNYNNFIN